MSTLQLKRLVHGILRFFGCDIHFLKNQRLHSQRQYHQRQIDELIFLQKTGIKTVIDIGANIGQFADLARAVLPQAMIYSFEPLEDCYQQLQRRLENDNKFKAFRFACGDNNHKTTIHHDHFSPSSSMLPMAHLHKRVMPFTGNIEPEEVEVVRLDDVMADKQLNGPLLIKIDVQGYEDKVISGALQTLAKASIVIIEVSFEELYSGQPLFADIHGLMNQNNFYFQGLLQQYTNPETGRILYGDAVFVQNAKTSADL